jgi:hypothetical protein
MKLFPLIAIALVAVACLGLFALDPASAHSMLHFGASGAAAPLLLGSVLAAPAPALEFGRKDGSSGADPDDRQMKQAVADLKTATDEVKRFAEEAAAELKNLGKVTADTKTAADQALLKHTEISSRLDTIEQKLARSGSSGTAEMKSVGQQFVESEELKDFLGKGGKGRVRFGVKAIISSLTTDANGSAGDLIVPQRLPGIIGPQQRRLVMRDLITSGAPARTRSSM